MVSVDISVDGDDVLAAINSRMPIRDSFITALFDHFLASDQERKSHILSAFAISLVDPYYLVFSTHIRMAICNVLSCRGFFTKRFNLLDETTPCISRCDFVMREKARLLDLSIDIEQYAVNIVIEFLEDAGLPCIFDGTIKVDPECLNFDCSSDGVYSARLFSSKESKKAKDAFGAWTYVVRYPLHTLPEVALKLVDFIDVHLQENLARKLVLHDGMRQRLDESHDDIAKIIKDIKTQRGEKDYLKKANESITTELDKVTMELGKLTHHLRITTSQVDADKRVLECKRQELKQIRQGVAATCKELKSLEAAKLELENELKDIVMANNELDVAKLELKKKLTTIKGIQFEYLKAQEKEEAIRLELISKHKDIAMMNLEGKLKDITTANKEVDEELEIGRNELEKGRTDLEDLGAQCRVMSAGLMSCRQDLEGTKREVGAYTREINWAKHVLHTTRTDLTAIMGQIEHTSTELIRRSSELRILQYKAM